MIQYLKRQERDNESGQSGLEHIAIAHSHYHVIDALCTGLSELEHIEGGGSGVVGKATSCLESRRSRAHPPLWHSSFKETIYVFLPCSFVNIQYYG